MAERRYVLKVDDILRELVEQLRHAYPLGVPEDDYMALLAVLRDDMSERNLAIVVAELDRRRSGSGGQRCCRSAIGQETFPSCNRSRKVGARISGLASGFRLTNRPLIAADECAFAAVRPSRFANSRG